MQARMQNPALLIPEGLQALLALGAVSQARGVPTRTLELVKLRASQINGCSFCLDMHAKIMRKEGETDERLFTVAGWRDAPYFTDAERAALAFTEAVTRLADKEDAVSDALWAEVAAHYDEQAIAALLFTIGTINVWNRLNAATRQLAGSSLKARA